MTITLQDLFIRKAATPRNDCSWCAEENGDSPTICPRHEAELMAQLTARQAARSAAKEENTHLVGADTLVRASCRGGTV